MINLQKIIWKIPITTEKIATPDRFFKVFNTWIPDSPEIFIDAADYQHVHDGPLTVLVGHYADCVLDKTDDELGLMYKRKRDMAGDNPKKIKETLREALNVCQHLEEDKEFDGKLKFDPTKLKFIINDRAIAPNTNDSFDAIKSEIEAVLHGVFGKTKHSMEFADLDPRTRLTINISTKEKVSLNKLIENLDQA